MKSLIPPAVEDEPEGGKPHVSLMSFLDHVEGWSDHGWSEQEAEDEELDAALNEDPGDCASEGSEDELTALQNEMEMDLDDLMEK